MTLPSLARAHSHGSGLPSDDELFFGPCMPFDPGGKMYELIVNNRARQLIEHLGSVSPEVQAELTPREVCEAMLDAIGSLERDAKSISELDVLRRAREVVRGMLDDQAAAT